MAKLLGRIVLLCAGLWAAGGMMDAEMQRTQVRVSYQPKDSQSGVFVFFPTPVLWGLSFADCGRVRASDLDRMAVLFPWPWPGAGQPPSLCARFRCFTFPSSTLPPPAPGAGWFWAQPWPTEPSGCLQAASAPEDSLVSTVTALFVQLLPTWLLSHFLSPGCPATRHTCSRVL